MGKDVRREKVLVFFLVVLLLMCVFLPGCDSRPSTGKKLEEMPRDIEVVKDIAKDKSTLTDQDEGQLEIKHWKYGQPSAPRLGASDNSTPTVKSYLETDSDNWQPESIQLVTREEMDMAIACLAEMEYLDNNSVTEDQFLTALENYQRDRGLPVTGVLDGKTLQSLKSRGQ